MKGDPRCGRIKGKRLPATIAKLAVEAQLFEAWQSQSPGLLPQILDTALLAAVNGNFDPLRSILPYIARKMPDTTEHKGLEAVAEIILASYGK